MGDLATYSLVDFFPFSPEVYLRLIERLHQQVWPAQIALAIAGLAILWAAWRTRRGIMLALAGAWGTCAWAFFFDAYAALNWAGTYMGWAFVAQALLLAMASGVDLTRAHTREDPRPYTTAGEGARLAGALAGGAALLLYPWVGLLSGRDIAAIEWFALTPDATVLVTLAVLAGLDRTVWPLLILPCVWCIIAAITAWVMGLYSGMVLPIAAITVLGVRIRRAASRA